MIRLFQKHPIINKDISLSLLSNLRDTSYEDILSISETSYRKRDISEMIFNMINKAVSKWVVG